MPSPGSSDSHYFDAAPATSSSPRTIELVLPDVFLELSTDSGVFSAQQVDGGTRILLKDHPPLASLPTAPAHILDLGCGYGPIALSAAKRAPDAHVWGVDVNERALELAQGNAASNGIENVTFGRADQIPAEQHFDLILSNPPIRVGKQVLRDLLATWLDRLTPQGRAWMVVQKHLGSDSLAAWLTEQGWETTRLSSKAAYRILETLPRSTQ